MECFEARAALKSGIRFLESTSTEPADSQYSSLVDGFWAAAAGVGDEQFSVEEYFDLSAVEEGIKEGGFTFGEDEELEEEEELEEKVSLSSSSSASLSSMSSHDQLIDEGSSFYDAAGGSILFGSGELAIVPVDDMKELEIWSKHLMDDNTLPHEFTAAYPTTTGPYSFTRDPRPSTPTRPPTEPVTKPPVQLQATTIPLLPPKHPRSKLVRKPGMAWHFSPHLKAESLSSSSSSSSSSSTTSSSSVPGFVFVPNPLQQPAATAEESNHHRLSTKPAKKKQKRNRASSETSATGPVQARRCSHCQVQKTPQWRTGPLGPRTLCNACGVRFKSGRLFPEYRPACSPTFSSEVHSNSHRKVLEMRMKRKEVDNYN